MIMVFKVEMLLRHIEKLYPDVTNLFRGLSQAIGTREEGRRVEEIYGYLDPLNLFSKKSQFGSPRRFRYCRCCK